jgi:hypothetical protein
VALVIIGAGATTAMLMFPPQPERPRAKSATTMRDTRTAFIKALVGASLLGKLSILPE